MKALFFSILCIYFLNSSCLAEAEDLREEFVPPLVLSDYNSGVLFTNLGGLSGGDEELPGKTFAVVIPDDNFTKGNSGYSLMLDYDVSGLGEFSFYWIKLGPEVRGREGATHPLDLQRYNYLSFWIKGLAGGEKIKIELHQDIDDNGVFVFGNDITSYLYLDAYIPEGHLTQKWQKVIIPLKDFKGVADWSKALELVFVFENSAGNTRGSVYLDDILFGRRPEWILAAEDVKEIKPPVASSFRINGLLPEKCRAFARSNKLTIEAESIDENPFLESVTFQQSTDKGATWRTLSIDYDVNKNTYEFTWRPENSNQVYNYQLRAQATDIRGNEKATPVLIQSGVKPLTDDEFLNLVEEKAFRFFLEHQSMKTGLFADTTGGGDASIASTGFGITALCVGAKRGWINKQEAMERTSLALDAFLSEAPGEEPLVEGKYGFFYHFLNIHTGKRAGKAEISTVDTAILVCGALTAGEYFGGEIKRKAEKLYENVQWGEFLCKEAGPWYNVFSMGWSPERGFLSSYWDFYTDEVILISLLAIGSPTHPVDPEVFYAWIRHEGSYDEGKPFIYSWHGALFSYQYAHIWFDFRNLRDRQGINWFENSVRATLANRQFCIDHKEEFKTYGPNSWGITSMARPTAYTMHFGTPPCGSGEPQYDSTISPTGPAGSITFTPYLSLSALKYMYLTYPRLWGKYGLRDSYNLDLNWYSRAYYGIGEAMYVLPIENFRSGFIWEKFMKNRHVKEALRKAGFTKIKR
ncbi:MAG: glucoamylase family protein [Candidatus Omnitrophota bacterium]